MTETNNPLEEENTEELPQEELHVEEEKQTMSFGEITVPFVTFEQSMRLPLDLSSMKFQNLLIHDTETTGVAPEDRIIESAYIYFAPRGKLSYLEELNKAPIAIKPAAAMTHGYTNSMVEDLGPFEKTKGSKFLDKKSNDGKTFYIAHNSPFDLNMLQKEGINWDMTHVIDTLRIAQHLYQDLDEVEMYKLQYFRYLFEFDDKPYFKEAMDIVGLTEIKPHTAMSDIFVLWLFYAKIRSDFNLSNEQMVQLTSTPVIEKKLNFGNIFEKGTMSYDEVVRATYSQYGKTKRGFDYLDWAVENMGMSLDREYTIKKAMSEALICGDVDYKEKHQSLLYWGIMYVFNNEQISLALAMLKQKDNFRQFLITTSEKKFEEYMEQDRTNLTSDEEQELKNKVFMNAYVKNYRKDIILGV